MGSALLAALFNLGLVWAADHFVALVVLRVLTGVALAGIYPIGMKIASGWYARGLGGALGWLVGALVVGTAIPHGIRALGGGLHWTTVVVGTSVLCAAGGVLLAATVPDGPHIAKGGRLNVGAAVDLVRRPALRRAALGYLGHMWELYTFWALVPVILATAAVGGHDGAVSGSIDNVLDRSWT